MNINLKTEIGPFEGTPQGRGTDRRPHPPSGTGVRHAGDMGFSDGRFGLENQGSVDGEPLKITENTKYVVRDWTTHRAITQGANRTNAHAVRRHLGDRFYVFNRIIRKESR